MSPQQFGREHLWLAVTTSLFAAAYAAVGLTRHWHFASNIDLAIFDQAVWHLSRFETPASTISGFPNILGDHFYPIVALLAPLYWIAPSPQTLIVAQSILLGSSIVPVFRFARRRLPFGTTMALCVAYGLFWGMQRTAMSDVHEMAFAPLFVAAAILALDRRRWGQLWLTSIGLLLVKEDLIPMVAAFGAYLWWQGERRHGIALIVVGVVGFFAIIGLVIPWFGGPGEWTHAGAFQGVLREPWMLPAMVVTPPQKLVTLLCWIGPFLFLPVLSRYGLLLVPVMLERLLSTDVRHFGTGFHYSAPLAPILAMTASDGLARVREWVGPHRRGMLRAALALIVIACATVPGHQPILRLARARQYAPRPYRDTAMRALARIPPDAVVVAQSSLLPWLSQRRDIYLLDQHAPDAQYVIASTHLDPWPNASIGDVDSLIEERRRQGYVTDFEQDGWTVLRKK